MFVTSCTVADCKLGEKLIQGAEDDYLLSNKGYDYDSIIETAKKNGMEPVIPPRKNRKIQRYFDKEIYKLRCFVENASLYLKRRRSISTRYVKNTSSFLASVNRCLALWASYRANFV